MAPASKRRKLGENQVETVTFDPAARQEYLTGFSKRKKARIQHARDEAVKKEKEERVRDRRELREKRKEEREQHVEAVNAELKKQNAMLNGEEDDDLRDGLEDDAQETWEGIDQNANLLEPVAEEAEYDDEDKYTTVTVEAMGASEDEREEERKTTYQQTDISQEEAAKKRHSNNEKPKIKKKKFRYESKAERAVSRQKQKSKNRIAKARRKGD